LKNGNITHEQKIYLNSILIYFYYLGLCGLGKTTRLQNIGKTKLETFQRLKFGGPQPAVDLEKSQGFKKLARLNWKLLKCFFKPVLKSGDPQPAVDLDKSQGWKNLAKLNWKLLKGFSKPVLNVNIFVQRPNQNCFTTKLCLTKAHNPVHYQKNLKEQNNKFDQFDQI
jgi:hypothetical protein